MSDEPIYCAECDNHLRRHAGESRDLPIWRWLCLAAPVEDAPHFVAPGLRLTEPYRRCSTVNTDGRCPMFVPKREAAGEKERGDLRGAAPDKKLFNKCLNQASE